MVREIDIAVYARWAGGQEGMLGSPEEMPLEPCAAESCHTAFSGMTETGEWEEIGRGRGIGSPEEFDLGTISSTKKILISSNPREFPRFI